MVDWTVAYILVGIIIPLAYIACASYGVYKQRRAAAHATAVQKRQEGLYETYWYASKQGSGTAATDNNHNHNHTRTATNDNGIYGLFGTRELADMSKRKAERKAAQVPGHRMGNMTVRDAGEGSSRDLTHDYYAHASHPQTAAHNANQEAVDDSIYWNAV